MSPLQRISERIGRQGDVNDPATPRPLLTLKEFFEGNDIIGSICCNLNPTPSPLQVYCALSNIASKPEVADVRVQVALFDSPDWPFSDTVWIITSAAPEQVRRWFPEAMRPDECRVGWAEGIELEPCAVPAGMQPVRCWWD
jgi:hypothetical protein